MSAKTLFDKVWSAHKIAERDGGDTLLWVDRHFVHEGSFQAFDQVKARGVRVAEPTLTFGVADHYVPTRNRPAIANPEIFEDAPHDVRHLSYREAGVLSYGGHRVVAFETQPGPWSGKRRLADEAPPRSEPRKHDSKHQRNEGERTSASHQ